MALNLTTYPKPGRATPAIQPRWAVNVREGEPRPVDPRPQVIDPRAALEIHSVRQPGQTRSYASVLAAVRHGLRQGERLIVVTGDSGTGKTMLCRALIEEAELLTHTSVMLQPPATAEDLLAHFLRDVGVLDNGTSAVLMTRNSLVFALQRFLESLIPVGGRAVLVIDEAQHLTPVVLEQLRLALNFETGDSALLQVVLVGQPELDTLLRWPEMRRVSQRVSRRCELTGIEPDEFSTYLEEALERRSPGGLVRFTPAAERTLVSLSRAVPRVAERLCVHSLELAAADNSRRVEPRMVKTAARRLGLDHAATPRDLRKMGAAAAAVLACAVIGGGAWGWARRTPAADATSPASGVSTAATAAAAVPAAPLASAALETGRSLTVTVATFRTESKARAVVAQLVDEGFPAFPRSKGENGPYQVIVGPYASTEEAVAAQKSLAAKGAAGTEVRIETADLSRTAWQ